MIKYKVVIFFKNQAEYIPQKYENVSLIKTEEGFLYLISESTIVITNLDQVHQVITQEVEGS